MIKQVVPAAPVAGFDITASSNNQVKASPASKQIAPLDAAFLGRTYRTCLWFSAVMTLCVYLIFQAPMFTWSFGGGALLATLLLKSQEMFVRRLVRPKDAPPYEGWDAEFPLWILVPLKYVIIIAALAWLFRMHLIHPVGAVLGVGIIQFAIVSKVIGRMVSQKMRPLNEVYVRKTSV
jgi:hypothetical protein